MIALSLKVLEVQVYERPVILRLPFRFGIISLRECPQAFTRVLIQVEGHGEVWGLSAKALGPNWSDKNPVLSNDNSHDQPRASFRISGEHSIAAEPSTALAPFSSCYSNQLTKDAENGPSPLAAGYGQAVIGSRGPGRRLHRNKRHSGSGHPRKLTGD